MSSLDPCIINNAQKIYKSLNLGSQVCFDPLPVEISKMQQILLLFNQQKLESLVNDFLKDLSNKTITDFISILDLELEIFSMEQEDEEEFDISIKRSRSPSFDHSSNNKKHKIEHLSQNKQHESTHTILCSPCETFMLKNISWIILFEIARFIQSYELTWDEIPLQIFQMFTETASQDPTLLYETMIRWNQETRLGLKINALSFTKMDRCFENVWIHLKQINTESSILDHKLVHYSGVIRFRTRIASPTIQLRKPRIEPSNRLFRKFGPDRFLELKLAANTQPSLIKAHSAYFLKPFLLMGRTFKFLFIKDNTVVLFATEGDGLEPISIEQVINWHLPINENQTMTMSKYASRMSLGYSSSLPTLEFKPEEIIYIDDIYADNASIGDESACMTDGCGIISYSAMKHILGSQATEELPCAIQGRIAGAKGIWIIAPDLDLNCGNYIKIRKSQNKFKTGLPQKDLSLDPLHYTFDLVKRSVCVYPSNLNTQFIQCLAAGGVPIPVFVEILKEYIHRLSSMVTENQSIKLLRDWITRIGHIMAGRWEGDESLEKSLWNENETNEEEGNDNEFFTVDSSDDGRLNEDNTKEPSEMLDFFDYKKMSHSDKKSHTFNKLNKYSGHPYSLHETVVRMLDAGFDLSNAYVATRVTMVFRQIMQSITIKYKIEVLQSCTITCVPDPTGTLNPGEVFLQLSSRRKDEKTGVRVSQILGDVIVTRNPCGLKSDIQKVKAIDCTALRMYTDIIVFPVKGDSPLASQLSGGDYDGDIVFCCWDERIVKPFKSSPVVKESGRSKDAFETDKTTVGQEISKYDNPEEAIQKNFISVTLPDGTLGIYENWRTVLAERVPFDHPDVCYLAQMCAKLVDAPKQGLRLKPSIRAGDKAKFSDLPYPPWFMDKKNKQKKINGHTYQESTEVYTLQGAPCTTAMDFLYDTLLKETAAFTKYSRSMFYDPDVPFKEADLTTPWLNTFEYANKTNDIQLKADLQLIMNHVRKNQNEYNEQCAEYDLQKQQYYENCMNPTKFVNDKPVADELPHQFNSHFELEEYFAKDFLESPPIESFQSDVLIYDRMVNGGRLIYSLKGSYAYILSVASNKYSKYCYIMAYDILRRIKADACAKRTKDNGTSDSLTTFMYKSMNIDKGWLRKIKETNYVEEDAAKVRVIEDHSFYQHKK